MSPEVLLRAARAETLAQVASLEADVAAFVAASESDNADDEHDPEGATIAFERAQTHAVLQQARERLTALEAALGRVAAGSYGSCLVCGRRIGAERLAARPSAERCVTCASVA